MPGSIQQWEQPSQQPATWRYSIDRNGGVSTANYPGNVSVEGALIVPNIVSAIGFASMTAAVAAVIPGAVNEVPLAGYYSAGDGGGGNYIRASAGAGPGKFQSADGSWWILSDNLPNVRQFGAKGDNAADDTTAIQNAMDFAQTLFFPNGTYKITQLRFKRGGQRLLGSGADNTVLISSLATVGGSVFANNTPGTTLLRCEIQEMFIQAPLLTIGYVVDWRHMQHGYMSQVFVAGGSPTGAVGFNLGATWAVTECTYNTLIGCYAGNVQHGFFFGDGANNNSLINCRAQPGMIISGVPTAGGYGFIFFGNAAGRISDNTLVGCSVEFPNNLSRGVFCSTGVEGLTIMSMRLEQLLYGYEITATAFGIGIYNPYFSGVTNQYAINAASGTSILDAISLSFGSKQVVGVRNTGWTASGGTAAKTGVIAQAAGVAPGGYNQGNYQDCLNRVAVLEANLAALNIALTTAGMIGA